MYIEEAICYQEARCPCTSTFKDARSFPRNNARYAKSFFKGLSLLGLGLEGLDTRQRLVVDAKNQSFLNGLNH